MENCVLDSPPGSETDLAYASIFMKDRSIFHETESDTGVIVHWRLITKLIDVHEGTIWSFYFNLNLTYLFNFSPNTLRYSAIDVFVRLGSAGYRSEDVIASGDKRPLTAVYLRDVIHEQMPRW